jgi:hypothetical protein
LKIDNGDLMKEMKEVERYQEDEYEEEEDRKRW